MRDLYSNLSGESTVANAVLTTSADGTVIDMQGFNSLMIIADVGASGDTLSGSVLVELEVEESDDDITYTDVADADLQNVVVGTNPGTFALIDDPAEDEAVYATGYLGNKRYVRAVANLTGTHTNGIPISIMALRGNPGNAPVNP